MSNLHGHRFGWVRLHKDVLQPHVFFSRCEDCPSPERYLHLKQAELIRSLWQPLVKFLQKTEMICLTTTQHPSRLLCTQPKIGNPYWLAAISPAARWTSAAARSVNFFFFPCTFVCFHPHFCELHLASTGDFKSVCSLFWRNGGGDVWFLKCGDDTLGSLLLHPVVSRWSLTKEFKTPGVVCLVCLSYQPVLRCLLTLTSIVLIQSFHSSQRLHRGCWL